MIFSWAALVLVLVQAGPPEVAGTPVNGVTLRYLDVVKGTGAPALGGKRYTVHYTGWLTNGKQFDSSLTRQVPLDFVQGRRQVIAGWDLGFEGMNVGGKRRLFIPPQLGYGDKGAGANIPPGAELIFDVELLGVAEAPELPAAVEVLVPFAGLEKKVMALAESSPEENYRSGKRFGELMGEIGSEIRAMVAIAVGRKLSEPRNRPLGKAMTVDELRSSFANARKAMEGMRSGGLSHDAEVQGERTTRKGVFAIMDVRIAELYGEASVIAGAPVR